ncbi:MMS19 nucleotide excision repair protein homolog [Diabrotica virgifera virgifera]|uniref:MMS19 nucleotide excision repair protein n=1 Tax=Diabrotica virgifera virgifera TaxID=50390 RepID=A0A6P7FMB0_DIAVI|nr:MMS19 nucleotide excision repair protein homolog [Diabrotica virgifera virgifera]
MELLTIINQFEDKEDATFKENTLVISKGIQEQTIAILDLIEHLDTLLTNDHASKRDLGISILTEVLKNISEDSLNKQQLEVLAVFYGNKLNDHHQVLPGTLSGILRLIQFKDFPGEQVPVLLNLIHKNVPCQQQQRADRHTIYQIFEISLKLHKEKILEMKLEFVYIVLTLVDGERDPRNLLFLFKWMKVFLDHFDLKHLTEDIFDVLACYFPVDFRAPPSESSITREALSEALTPCLCAKPEFGDSCITLALEKLDSSLEIAKTDSLKLLTGGCVTFPTSIYLEKAPEIWSLLQKEILTNTPDNIRQECLTTLTIIISKISEGRTDEFLDVLQNILDTLKGNLLPDSKLFEKSSQILLYVVAGSEHACNYIIKEVVPILTNIYSMTAYNNQKSIIVQTLVEFAKHTIKFNKTLYVREVPELLKIPSLCLEILNYDHNSRRVGFDCLTVLVPHLAVETRLEVYTALQTAMFNNETPETRNSYLTCLKSAAIAFPTEVKTNILQKVNCEPQLMDSLLSSLTVLVNVKEFKDYVINTFVEALKKMELSSIAIKNLKCLVQRFKEQNNTRLLKELITYNILDILVELVLTRNCTVNEVSDVSKILKVLISPQATDLQIAIYDKYFESIFDKISYCDLNMVIMDGLVSTLRQDVKVDYKLLDICRAFSIEGQNDIVRSTACELLANLVNKKDDDENLAEFLNKTKDKCSSSVINYSKNTVLLLSWITKALLMRNHRCGLIWLDWLLQLLEDNRDVPKGFRIIMNDYSEALSLEVHCNKLALYRQKAFVYVTNKIIERYNQSKPEYLAALGYLLEFTPQQAILLQFPKISRFVILCLEKNKEPKVLVVILGIIKMICNTNSALLERNLEDFLNRIVQLTVFKESMRVRIEAIQCLTVFSLVFPVYKLLPLKSTVIYTLGTCVDDKKRLVRKEAMEARSLWFLLDAPV